MAFWKSKKQAAAEEALDLAMEKETVAVAAGRWEEVFFWALSGLMGTEEPASEEEVRQIVRRAEFIADEVFGVLERRFPSDAIIENVEE